MKREIKDMHIYFPVKVLNGIKKLAETNRRTVSAEIVIAVERYVKQERARSVSCAISASDEELM
jgi:hypothetical protein